MGLKTAKSFRTVVNALLVSTMVVAGTAVLSTTPAAASAIVTLPATSWSYIDSAAPRSSFVNPAGDAPIGAHTYANGTNHVSKSYLTFDLSSLRGHRLISSYFGAGEAAVTDCANPRATELWLTDPAKKPTWNNQPAELLKVGGPYLDGSCPSREVGWNATTAIQAALDAGRTSATFVLRLPDAQQNDPRFGREYDPVAHLEVNYNRAPGKPSQLTVYGKPCSNKPQMAGAGSVQIGAVVTDPDDSYLGGEFAIWPVDHPDQRTTLPNSGSSVGNGVSVYVDKLVADGVTYAWQVRGKDRLDFGPWSSICQFTVDQTPPAAAPAVTSTDYVDAYPGTGGSGIPGAFTFDAKGDKDVTGFYYGEFFANTYVAADHRGGKATIRYAPGTSGPGNTLRVSSADAAGNSSPSVDYRFWVASNEPLVDCAPFSGFVGEQRQCTFSPRGSVGVSAYVYSVNSGEEDTVTAGADGHAVVTLTPSDPRMTSYTVSVRAKLTNGYTTGARSGYLNVDLGEPEITGPADPVVAGAPATFTVHSVLPGSVSFTYRGSDGELVTVPVKEDGTATVTLATTTSGWLTLSGYTTTAAGQQSGWGSGNVTVLSNRPNVTSADYPENQTSGAVGVPGTFVFSSPVPGAVSYTYKFGNAAPITVPAGTEGTAAVTFTPVTASYQSVRVTSTLAGGVVSESQDYQFWVAYSAPQVSCDNSGWLKPGQQVQCTAHPVQAGLVSYGYTVDSGPENTVPAGADGTATITFTVPADQHPGSYVQLRVWSVNAAGLRTESYATAFYVDSPSAAAAGRPRGAV